MLVIGEKLSIIAKRVREAMMKRDKSPIQDIAVSQWKAGAGMIDANIGPAEDGGEALMQWMITTIQEAVPLPVCLDTTKPGLHRQVYAHFGKNCDSLRLTLESCWAQHLTRSICGKRR